MARDSCPALLVFTMLLLLAGRAVAEPQALFNTLLNLLNPSAAAAAAAGAAGAPAAQDALALSHLDHQLGALSALADALGAGLNLTDSVLG